jgi:hypothetical protein
MDRIKLTKDDARRIGLGLVLLAGAGVFARVVHGSYPIQNWLIWRYVGYWFGAACWAAALLSFGHRVLNRVFKGTLRKSELFMLALPFGGFSFGLSIFVIGLAHGLNVVTFFLLPAAFFAFGVRGLARDLRATLDKLRFKGELSLSVWSLPALAFGVVAFGLLYVQTLHPHGFTFDARWYHLTIAQRYALEHRVGPFPEGFWNQAWPHLFSYHYAWAFLAPLPLIFDRLELCAHLEVMTFVMTLAQVPIMVRRLVPGARVGVSWVLFLLFPGLYLYDSNLCAGADHFAAFFALPIALTFLRAFHSYRLENVALFAFFGAAAFLTKYTATPIALVPSLVLLGRGVWLVLKHRDIGALKCIGALALISLTFTAPNWLANYIWFGDPVYPMLSKYFNTHPYVEDTASQVKLVFGTNRPGQLDRDGLLAALRATVTFSFVPNDWWDMHRDVPVFGSLFTLTLPCLAFVRGAKRVAWLYAMAMASVFCWYLLNHYDRYLQATLPWMVAATAGCLVLIWRSGGVVRYAVVPLIALQLAWGSDVPFITTHNLIGDSPLRHTAKFLASGFEQQRGRLNVYAPMPAIGREVPKDATLLIHDAILTLGTDRKWVADLHQSRISYGRLLNPKAIHQMLHEQLGVTHLAWPGNSIYRDTLAGDLAFAYYANNYTLKQRQVNGFTVADLPKQAPTEDKADYDVAYFSCGSPYSSGMYHLSQLRLTVVEPGPRPKPLSKLPKNELALERADMLVIERGCHASVSPGPEFLRGANRGSAELWYRRRK